MDKKKRFQVVIMVAAVFLCGVLYIILGKMHLLGIGQAATDEITFTSGGVRADTGQPDGSETSKTGTSSGIETTDASEIKDSSGAGKAEESETEVVVYVCGAVKKPGVYTFDHTPRLVEAVETAGGFTKKADLASVNLASVLEDGAKAVIFEKGEAPAEAADSSSGDSGGEDADRIDINSAGHEELMKIPGIGDAKASAIEAYRDEHGRFSKPEDLMQISGIKQGTFDRIKDYIRV